MSRRSYLRLLAPAVAMALAGAVPAARSEIIDTSKYPDFTGRWERSEVFQWARGEKPPLTPEYQAVYESNIRDRAIGGQGFDTMYRCFPPGMPRQMHVYAP